ncbi:MAG TPA: NAD-dependent epimerase/dehydratase family protein [Bacteriovoracaceae bacterium]|nr:NAD-dependent epimerase/dehydratase family protein [Bacteriovoracaceae bacterium]
MKVLVTGANGFVGAALIPKLIEAGHKVTALVRSLDKKPKKSHDGVKWIEGDLLQPETLPKIGQIDKAFYLVHGLKGQASIFEYLESMAAVNFLNWVRASSPDIVYLGGLAPKEEILSPHLRSRVLTGAILGASGLTTIEFRASIILGAGSLSFEMIKALAERLPFRPDFSVLDRPCQPLALNDLLTYLEAALDIEKNGHRIVEIGGPDVASYGELIDLYSELAGLKRKKIKLPEVESKVLLKALDYSIPEHADIGKKLAESLEHTTVVTDTSAKRLFPDIKPVELRVAMDVARSTSTTHYAPLWERDFLKSLLSDKILTQSGLLSPELLKNLERVGKLKDILSRKS